jgi:hypothetical protein
MAYTTEATARGGRNGRTILESGGFGMVMALPNMIAAAMQTTIRNGSR